MVNSGLWAKPGWFEAAKRAPPPRKVMAPRPPTLKLPEEGLYKTILKRIPILELEQEGPMDFQRTIAHRFAKKQRIYMEKEKLSERDAYLKCEADFTDEIKKFGAKLDEVHTSGAQRISFETIKKNVSIHSKVSNSIAMLLETRIAFEKGRLLDDPLESPHDTRERRRIKMERLMTDPGIAFIKQEFAALKPPVVRALEDLVQNPGSDSAEFYQSQVKDYLLQVQKHGNLRYPEGKRSISDDDKAALVTAQHSIRSLIELATHSPFSSWSPQQQVECIRLVQLVLKHHLVPKEPIEGVFADTEKQHTFETIQKLKTDLGVAESLRSRREILGRLYPYHLETHWWRNSPERQKFLADIERRKAEGTV